MIENLLPSSFIVKGVIFGLIVLGVIWVARPNEYKE